MQLQSAYLMSDGVEGYPGAGTPRIMVLVQRMMVLDNWRRWRCSTGAGPMVTDITTGGTVGAGGPGVHGEHMVLQQHMLVVAGGGKIQSSIFAGGGAGSYPPGPGSPLGGPGAGGYTGNGSLLELIHWWRRWRWRNGQEVDLFQIGGGMVVLASLSVVIRIAIRTRICKKQLVVI